MLEVSWGDSSRTILHWRFRGSWSASEMLVGFSEAQGLLDEAGGLTSTLLDFSEADGGPRNLISAYPQIAQASKLLLRHPNNRGQLVLVAESVRMITLVQMMLDIFERLYQVHIETRPSVEAAYRYLEENA